MILSRTRPLAVIMRGEIPMFSLTIPMVRFSAHPYDFAALFGGSSAKVISCPV